MIYPFLLSRCCLLIHDLSITNNSSKSGVPIIMYHKQNLTAFQMLKWLRWCNAIDVYKCWRTYVLQNTHNICWTYMFGWNIKKRKIDNRNIKYECSWICWSIFLGRHPIVQSTVSLFVVLEFDIPYVIYTSRISIWI